MSMGDRDKNTIVRIEECWKKWQNAASNSTFSTIYPNAEICWNSSADTYDLGMGNSMDRVTVVMNELKRLGYDDGMLQSALDIGSGTGNYTLPLAELVGHVTALDCAEKMNDRLRSKLKQRQIENVSVITADFMEYSFGQQYDLVLGSMNPGLYNPDAFIRMLHLTRKILIYVGIVPTRQVASQNNKKTVEELLVGIRSTHGGSNDIAYPYQLLAAMGYHPYIREVECSWSYEEEIEKVLQRMRQQYSAWKSICADWEDCLVRYTEEHTINGKIVNEGTFRLGILFCECSVFSNKLKDIKRFRLLT